MMPLSFIKKLQIFFTVCGLFVAQASGLQAQTKTFAPPTGDVILTISGKITATNVGDTAQFDREMLDAMERVSIKTATPWYDDVMTFEGVPIKTVMDFVGAKGNDLRVIALNDYVSEVPMQDVETTGVIFASAINGKPIGIRERGPIFIIYPYDSDVALQSQTYYGRSAWQVAHVIVE